MRRPLFTTAAMLSLLSCAAACAVWGSGLNGIQSSVWSESKPLTATRLSAGIDSQTVSIGLIAPSQAQPAVLWRWRGFVYAHLPAMSEVNGRLNHLGVSRSVSVPLWAIAAVSGVLPTLWLLACRGRATRGRLGLCACCGYDLRATPERCPECGASAQPSPLQRSGRAAEIF